jgi:hypothetical protein
MTITGMHQGHGLDAIGTSVQAQAQATTTTTAAAGHVEPAGEHEVRDADRAQFFQDIIRATVQNRFPDVESLVAAGYTPTRTDIDGPVHYTLGGYTNNDTSLDGGVSDFSRPFSVVVEDGRITGVMLRAPQGEVDFGAGTWHQHAEDAGGIPLMHVWFDKPLEEAFGGHLPGFDPREPMPAPGPVKEPTPGPTPGPGPKPEPMPMPMPHPMPMPPAPKPFPMPLPMPSPVPPPPVDGPGCCHSHGAHPTQFPLG